MQVANKFWFWLMIIGVLLIIGGLIGFAIIRKSKWWLWLMTGIGILLILIGVIWSAMECKNKSNENKTITTITKGNDTVILKPLPTLQTSKNVNSSQSPIICTLPQYSTMNQPIAI